MGRMTGKVAFLTGAGSGIAKATALAYAAEGARVALAELNPETGQATEKLVRDAGGEAMFIQTDVTSDDSVRAAIASTVERFGGLTVLFNCAGGSLQEDVAVHQMNLDIWHKTMALNLLHPFLTCRYAIPHMMKAGVGSIINVTSHMGLTGQTKPAYSAAKGGLISFTKTLAGQYAMHGIRANAIAPGSVRSERSIKRWENAETAAANPLLRNRQIRNSLYPFSVGEPQDIAAVAVFLGSDESRMLTGTTIAADGGRSAYLKVYNPDAPAAR
jgi:NAD(P)-dependent dehydrogenase (short-subunit alcohol dehydrogenase family)